MYYDNKSTFYIKQYGPAVITIAICLVLVFGGLYIYLSSNKNNMPNDSLVAKTVSNENELVAKQSDFSEIEEQDDSLEDVVSNVEEIKHQEPEIIQENTVSALTAEETEIIPEEKVEDVTNITYNTVLTSELKNLKKLEKSHEVTVLGIDDEYNILLEVSNNNYKASLIGIDYKKSSKNIKERLNNDLVNKKVRVAFDNVRLQDGKLCVYLYVDENLYNEQLLNDGLAIINVEKANTSMLNNLVVAQKDAKLNSLGIWNK